MEPFSRLDRVNMACSYDTMFDTMGIKLPQFRFRSDWLVRMIPPFGGAIVRFSIARDIEPKAEVSVYYDAFGLLGGCDKPYWEIYPSANGLPARFFGEKDFDAMSAAIEAALDTTPLLKGLFEIKAGLNER
jgi:hypothetical protein